MTTLIGQNTGKWLLLPTVVLLTAGCERVNTLVGPNKLRGKILFQTRSNHYSQLLFLYPDDPGNLRRVVITQTLEYAPRWAPDGRKIAFLSDREGQLGLYRLYLMEANGTNVQPLFDPVRHPEGDLEFSWAPNGNHIALIRSQNNRRQMLIVDTRTLDRQLVLSALPNRFYLDWSPDGSQIALISNDPRNPEGAFLQLLSYPDLTLRTVDVGYKEVTFPRFSPDGKQLAFLAHPNPASTTFQLFVADTQTFHARQISHLDGGIPLPGPISWAPDGHHIIFSTPGTNVFIPSFRDLYSIDINGRELSRLTFNPDDDLAPDWTAHD
ncbi:MAG: PD40 domain-containing protein [candidate division Zixibacteria bacterium]|nr:PD40 domain-containing protein [candidate division Zixibacteria bacterium]